jgi:hypothetical protein
MATDAAGKRAWAPNTLPVRRWQARQWQTETRTGSAEVTAESWPHEQEAVRVGIVGPGRKAVRLLAPDESARREAKRDSRLTLAEIARAFASQIGVHIAARALIDDFASHRAAGVGHPVAGRRKPASHAVNPFAEDNFYPVGTLAHDDDIKGLSCCGYANRDLVGIHSMATLCRRTSP